MPPLRGSGGTPLPGQQEPWPSCGAPSITLGEVRGHDLIRMLSRDGKPTGLGDAFAHYGRIFRTLHLIQFVSDEGYRRMIGAQLNVAAARHRLARILFFGQRGELRQRYREGMEDQFGALGLALNAVVLFNSLSIDAAVEQLAADGFPVTAELLTRLSPLQYDRINFLSRSAFTRPPAPGLRQLRDPHSDDETDDGEDGWPRARTGEQRSGPEPHLRLRTGPFCAIPLTSGQDAQVRPALSQPRRAGTGRSGAPSAERAPESSTSEPTRTDRLRSV
ncbi:Tn3 family transposase [Streptomyces sp. NPDC001714]|uniref:Tn3 family transposase n=1 Tax=Streptomyces sp. NPDC001714 TaxID=3364603 RepID=UPI003689B54B